jgi:hypothetical protein
MLGVTNAQLDGCRPTDVVLDEFTLFLDNSHVT